MNDKTKPLSIIDSTQDKNVAYPATSKNIFNPYTGAVLTTVDEKARYANFIMQATTKSALSSVITRDNIQFNLVIPTVRVQLLKYGVLYYKFRLFLSFNSLDFYTESGNKDKEVFCDVNLFNDISGITLDTKRETIAQVELSEQFRSAVVQLFSKYSINELIATIPSIKDNTYTTTDEKVLAITENFSDLVVYAQIAPVYLGNGATDLTTTQYDNARQLVISACSFSLPEPVFSVVNSPTINSTAVTLVVKHKQVKSLKIKFSLTDSAEQPFSASDSTTRTIHLVDYAGVPTADGLTQTTIKYSLSSLFNVVSGSPAIISSSALTSQLSMSNSQVTNLRNTVRKLSFLKLEIISVEYVTLINSTSVYSKYLLQMPVSSKISIPSYEAKSLIYNSQQTPSITISFTMPNTTAGYKLPAAMLVLYSSANVVSSYYQESVAQIAYDAKTKSGKYSLTMPIVQNTSYNLSFDIYLFDELLSTKSNLQPFTLEKINLTTINVRSWFTYFSKAGRISFNLFSPAVPITGAIDVGLIPIIPPGNVVSKTIIERRFINLSIITGNLGNIAPILSIGSVYNAIYFKIPDVNLNQSFFITSGSNYFGASPLLKTSWSIVNK